MMPKVTIIVPIYNVEAYIRQCLDSIASQTLQDIEIILINDGSQDQSPEIINEYTSRDARFISIHQRNCGYGKTINRGIEIAHGEYIGIIEPDDWIESSMFELLYANATEKQTDVTRCCYYIYNPTANTADSINIPWRGRFDLMEAPDGVFSVREYPALLSLHPAIWSALYRADFIRKIKFIETPGASYQDNPFLYEYLVLAKRISIVKKYLVHYRHYAGCQNSSFQCGEQFYYMPQQLALAVGILREANMLLKPFNEYAYYQIYGTLSSFFDRIRYRYRAVFFCMMRELFCLFEKDTAFNYELFRKDEKKFALDVLKSESYAELITRQRVWKNQGEMRKNIITGKTTKKICSKLLII
jgi:glycosyltransferase involved in cell wall biosynthesis